METYKVFNLNREPFSNSPDPEFFYQSRQHVGCLQKLELAVRLRRGLNVVIGDVGTGKTTLCRQFIRQCADDERLESHLILDPGFSSRTEFLDSLVALLGLPASEGSDSEWQTRESIKKYLFRRAVDEGKIVVLIVDEGQKIPEFCLEPLREFLNYETNEHKLLQIIIFAQGEFEATVAAHPNFADRVNLYHRLEPLSFAETREMIRFRLNRAKDGHGPPGLFTWMGLWTVYRVTGGYPRQIVHLCHRVLLTLIVQNRRRAGRGVVRWCSGMMFPRRRRWSPWLRFAGIAAIAALLLAGTFAGWHAKDSLPPAARQVVPSPPVAAGTPEPAAADAPRNGTSSPEAVTPARVPTEAAARPEPDVRVLDEGRPPAAKPPRFLGKVTLARGETLGALIQKIYGAYDSRCLQALVAANPHIRKVENVGLRTAIEIPTIPAAAGEPLLHGWRVVLAVREDLAAADAFYKKCREANLPVRFIPWWSPREGLRFGVVMGPCRDEQGARTILETLPPQYTSEAGMVAGWYEDTVLYAK